MGKNGEKTNSDERPRRLFFSNRVFETVGLFERRWILNQTVLFKTVVVKSDIIY